MKKYPSISKVAALGQNVYVFGKYDGSCLRVELSPKNGFSKFGRRNGLLDDSNPILKRGPDLFLAKYAHDLDKIFRAQRWSNVTCFFEFFVANSFAGAHDPEEQQDVVLFDVSVYKQGLLDPATFLKLFRHLDVQELLYNGNVTQELISDIKSGNLPGMPFEGVICKGSLNRKTGLPLMFKIKSDAWLDKLMRRCGGDQKLFEMLS